MWGPQFIAQIWLIRAMSDCRIIGELKYECTAVTDKLEEAVRAYADDKVSELTEVG